MLMLAIIADRGSILVVDADAFLNGFGLMFLFVLFVCLDDPFFLGHGLQDQGKEFVEILLYWLMGK